MIMDHDGNIIDGAYIHDNMRLFECYRVTVYRNEFKDGKRVVEICGEEDYQIEPTDTQKMYCLAKYKGDYAKTDLISTIEYLPFSDIGEDRELPEFLK